MKRKKLLRLGNHPAFIINHHNIELLRLFFLQERNEDMVGPRKSDKLMLTLILNYLDRNLMNLPEDNHV